MKNYAIIVAGGKGERMGSHMPKQFLEVHGLPLIMHTLKLFHKFDKSIQLIVVLPSGHISTWKQLCITHAFDLDHTIADGGPARFHSVKSGLKHVPDDESIVAVHDAVRPLVSLEVIAAAYKDAAYYGNAVPVIPIKDSVRERKGPDNKALDRSNLFLVQTPQCFRASMLKKAYMQAYREDFTDDAAVVESEGEKIHLIEGNPENIKVTTQNDLLIVEALLRSRE